jgi:hypothetical protein
VLLPNLAVIFTILNQKAEGLVAIITISMSRAAGPRPHMGQLRSRIIAFVSSIAVDNIPIRIGKLRIQANGA